MDDEINLNFDDDEYSYYVDLERVIHSNTISPAVRLLALDLKRNSYISLGDYFKPLTLSALNELVYLANNYDTNEQCLQNFSLLTMLLGQAEGVSVGSNNERLTKAMHMLATIICCVSLERKQLVNVFYENLTLGDDMKDKDIVQRRDPPDPYMQPS